MKLTVTVETDDDRTLEFEALSTHDLAGTLQIAADALGQELDHAN